MANEMMAVQHSCKGLLRFTLLDGTVTVDMEVMTLKRGHIFKQDNTLVRKVLSPGVRRIHLLQHS